MSAEDAAALAGLRRLVLHSRDLLTASAPTMPEPSNYNPAAIRAAGTNHAAAIAAQTLAVEVLTLVADCLPEADALPGVGE